jgi:hypothetical protein
MTSFFGGAGGSSCDAVEPRSEPGMVAPEAVAAGQLPEICLFGFRAGRPLTIRVTRPDGSVTADEVCFACIDPELERVVSWPWSTLPGDALGGYRIVAAQGEASVSATVRLDHARTLPAPPLLRVVEGGPSRTAVSRGKPIHVVLVGFEPRQVVRVLIYQAKRGGLAQYITSVVLATDTHGERLWTIPTSLKDPAGLYVLRSQPQVDYRNFPGEIITDYIDSFTLA